MSDFSEALRLHRAGRLAEAEAIYRVLPAEPVVLQHLGLLRAERGSLEEGRGLIAEALRQDPQLRDAAAQLGSVLAALGRTEEALAAVAIALAQAPDNAELHFASGNALFQLGRFAAAAEAYAQADHFQPGRLEVLLNWGSALQEDGKLEDALILCDRVLALSPAHAGAHNNRGNCLRLLRRFSEALVDFEAALKADPSYLMARFNQATVLQAIRRHDAALRDCDRVILQAPGHAPAHVLRGTVLVSLNRAVEALASFERALALDPALEAAHHGRISALLNATRWEEALAAAEQALAKDPRSTIAHNNRGVALMKLRRLEEAKQAFQAALDLDGQSPEAWFNRAGYYLGTDQLDAAYDDTAKALGLRPDFLEARCLQFGLAAHLCDWRRRAKECDAIAGFCADGERIDPFPLTYAFDDPQMHLEAAKRVAERPQPALNRVVVAPREKLRIAYLSADFRNHPVTHQMIEVWESHDRSRVETVAVALWPLPEDDLGARLRGAFDVVVEAYDRSDAAIARRIAELPIDIAVELGGFTDKARPGILAYRPAPLAVNYLGYPGTLGAGYIDYIIADPIVISPADDDFYAERVARLDCCLMPFDSTTGISAPIPSRAEQGLPEEGFVFCNFNKTDKFTPAMFDVWMRILAQVPGSVFWLSVPHHSARENLKREAAARGLDPARLVFAARAPSRAEHLARITLADLFLDSFPYNAHATTADFLFAGVPLLTLKGKSFASRVAASLLHSFDAAGLVAPDIAQYEAMALGFARDAAPLKVWRQQLAAMRPSAARSQHHARALENTYFAMWARRVAGLKPASFTLPL